MGAAKSNEEVEIKLALRDAALGRRLLRQAGWRPHGRRLREGNVLYDTRGHTLRRRGQLLRLRTAGGQALLTFKGRSRPARHKVREELEVSVSKAAVLEAILERLGLCPVFRYEKYRTEYRKPGSPGVITLDETPIGDFLELEGPPAWIDRSARLLGFSEGDYVTASYGALYLDFCQRRGLPPSDMLFRERGKRP